MGPHSQLFLGTRVINYTFYMDILIKIQTTSLFWDIGRSFLWFPYVFLKSNSPVLTGADTIPTLLLLGEPVCWVWVGMANRQTDAEDIWPGPVVKPVTQAAPAAPGALFVLLWFLTGLARANRWIVGDLESKEKNLFRTKQLLGQQFLIHLWA